MGKGDLGFGLEDWRDYYQSLRPTELGLSLNIDSSARPFYESIMVTEFLLKLFRWRSLPKSLSDRDRFQAKRALKGAMVETTYQGYTKRFKINSLSAESADRLIMSLSSSTQNHLQKTVSPSRPSFKASAKVSNRPETITNPGVSFKSYAAQKVDSINGALDTAISLHHPEDATIHDAMRYSLFPGGKRLRPILCIAACELVGGSESTAMPAACAVEMIHTWSVIHDDLPCMDNSDMRWRKPTNHKMFGEDIALLAGDALLTYSIEHLTQATTAPAFQLLRVIRELSNAAGIGGVVTGQAADMRSQGVEEDARLERLEYIHYHKTARMLEASVVSGAIMGGGTVGQVEKLRNYARCIGLLYQLVDDVLNVTKTTEELGKTAGKDVEEGKVTYPKVVGLDKAREIADELQRDAKGFLSGFNEEKLTPLIAFVDFIPTIQS